MLICPFCMWSWEDFGKLLSLVVSRQHEMTSQKRSEQVWREWAGSSGDAAHSCRPVQCISQSSPEPGDFQQVNIDTALCRSLCIGGMFLLFDSCTCSDECYLITQLFSCFPSGLLGET